MLTDTQRRQFLSDLFTWISIPSISTLPEHKQDVLAAAKFAEEYLMETGFTSTQHLFAPGESVETRNPVVFAQRIDDPANKTILIYGHYDVQPVDPIDQWRSEPFKPEVRDGFIYARGSTDDKGQAFTHLAALRALSTEWGEKWPVNVKVILEGEEEMGSENLSAIIESGEFNEQLKADICLVSDGPWISPEHPTLTYGLRGITYMQIDVKLADADLHSGLFGGGVLNPAQALVYILSKLKDQETGKILVPGFLDDVEPISESEHDKLSKVPLSDQQFLSDAAHSKAVYGEEGYTTVERTTARPTLEINGIWGGYQGEGAKTIIPATAHAKVSMRLVGNQDPAKVGELFVDFVKQIAPSEVDVDVYTVHAGPAMLVNPDQPELKIAEAALRSAFEKDVVYARSGGSIPPIAMLQSQLGIKPILMDYGFADDNMHSPNERFSEDQFYRGIECNIAFLTEYSKLNN